MSADLGVPHSYANGRVVSDLGARLGVGPGSGAGWREIDVARINAAAAALLREDTARLEREQRGT